MFGIETIKNGVYNFDYFSIDLSGNGTFKMGGKEFTLGEFTRDISNLSKEFITELLRLGGELNRIRIDLLFAGEYDRKLFSNAKTQIHRILDYVKSEKPFCYFDITDSMRLVDEVFSQKSFDENDALRAGTIMPDTVEGQARIQEIKKLFELSKGLITVYCYIPNDVANFAMVAMNFTEYFMHLKSRQKDDLARCSAFFFSSDDVRNLFESFNLNKDLDGVNLRPRVTQVPVIAIDNKTNQPVIMRRLYFGRLMDFFVTEFFEAMMQGHYLWKCKVCKRYFLMQSAHRQLYCGQYNERYGTTCDHVANNRRIAQKQSLPKQSLKDNPLWQFHNKRYASIRQNKKLGKYSEAVSAEAKRILDECFETAEIDAEYAEKHYLEDIRLSKIYEQAIKNLQ